MLTPKENLELEEGPNKIFPEFFSPTLHAIHWKDPHRNLLCPSRAEVESHTRFKMFYRSSKASFESFRCVGLNLEKKNRERERAKLNLH